MQSRSRWQPDLFLGSIFTDQDPITRHDPAILRCRTDLTRWQPEIPLISHCQCGHSSKLAGVAVGNAGFGMDAAMRQRRARQLP